MYGGLIMIKKENELASTKPQAVKKKKKKKGCGCGQKLKKSQP